MKVNCSPRRVAWFALRVWFWAMIFQLSFPFLGGMYYSLCGDHSDEQLYLDDCIQYLKEMRACTADPDLQDILDYTIRRYSKIGAWDVMVMPLDGPFISPGYKVIGCNCPWCPGITLDPCLLLWQPEETAIVIAHEAMHDYYPFFGHNHIYPREQKLYELSNAIRRLYRSNVRRLLSS